MERTPEPELMNGPEQARAYAEADFAEAHDRFVALFRETFPGLRPTGCILDLGCGPADVTIRFARAFPECRVHGVDGAESMLAFGRTAVMRAGLADRIRLIHGLLPRARLPRAGYQAVISNSLLHHLHAPAVLWSAIRRWSEPGAPVFVMDLMRPEDPQAVESLVANYAADAPAVLQRDFRASLHAAYRVEEVEAQLVEAGIHGLAVQVVSDRHWVVAGHRVA
jgi:ubiquinone/menaquinone biosynthesis C-methylase UbiE